MTTAFQPGAFDSNGFEIDAEPLQGGGAEYWGGVQRRGKKLKQEQDEWAERLGLNPPAVEIIAQVALEQTQDLHLDEQQRFEQLTRELELKEIVFQTQHLEMLNRMREQLIDMEIKDLFRTKDEEEAMLLILIAANLT